jgi:hypothetical protein
MAKPSELATLINSLEADIASRQSMVDLLKAHAARTATPKARRTAATETPVAWADQPRRRRGRPRMAKPQVATEQVG